MTGARLPAYLEAAALIRAAEVAGGFGVVLSKGDRDAGVILVLTIDKGRNPRLWERMPRLDGSRAFECVRTQDADEVDALADYLKRRQARDSDLWLIELDVAEPERLIAEFAG